MKAPEQSQKINLAIFLSGKGTNTEALIKYFEGHPTIRVSALFTNNCSSGAERLSEKYSIPFYVFNKEEFKEPENKVADKLNQHRIQAIVLAGFLWLVPAWLVKRYPSKILNIHPALLPKYGGKGMYGRKVHEAVWQKKEKESGITVHLVNEQYDKGDVIAQYACPIENTDTVEDIERKVRTLELKYYPELTARYFLGEIGSK